jgi:hypothetical protein
MENWEIQMMKTNVLWILTWGGGGKQQIMSECWWGNYLESDLLKCTDNYID